ncbi:hypothetical protein CBS115989_2234 [Aspergillus niger]|nr:hypothetical protein CBS115989_2234 [Aspergillus niger]KAI2839669.1 hypothetical protein CBS11232_9310 [Aspergillus niger]KAI2869621.1 hypothetical protein CBS115988_9916 [Aspergillus niger]
MTSIRKSHDDYTLGWLTALSLERSAAEAVLDKRHHSLGGSPGDENTYTLGEIQGHNVAITCLPSGQYGIAAAANAASRMRISFPNIQYGLLVGIAGGVPDSPHADIRLGDIVIGQPTSTHPAVVQYDFGKSVDGVFQRIGRLDPPSSVLLSALSKLQANHTNKRSKVAEFLQKLGDCNELFRHPGQDQDRLFKPLYSHKGGARTCANCDQIQVIERSKRPSTEPIVHYGVVGTGNQVIKDAQMRQRLARQEQLLCFEMEAAGMVNEIPSLVIRGICDYSDTHKNKHWQGYAAAAAAAYAKDFLSVLPPYAYIENRFTLTMNLSGVPAICNFVGRNADLEKLARLLLPNASTSQKIVTLHGLSGIGKTQLALRFIQCHKEDFTAVFWVNAHTRESIVQSLASVHLPQSTDALTSDHPTHDEELEGNAMDVISWLSLRGNTKWLLVFDGMALDSAEVQKFFPKSDQGDLAMEPCVGLADASRRLGDLFLQYGKLQEAEVMYKTAHDWYQQLDPLSRELLIALDSLGLVYRNQSKYKEAEEIHEKVLADKQIRVGPEDPSTLDTTYHLAELYSSQGMLEKAKQMYERVLSGRRSMLGQSHPSTLSTMDKLGTVYLGLGELNDAMDYCQRAYQGYRKHRLITAMMNITNNIGLIYLKQGRFVDAAAYHTQVVKELEAILGENHPSVFNAMENLGLLYTKQGKFDEAKKHLFEALSHRKRVLGAEHPSIITTKDNIARLYVSQGKTDDAEREYKEALELANRMLSSNHISTLRLLNNLGNLYYSQGMFREAENNYLQAMAGYEAVVVPTHTSRLSVMVNLGNIYKLQDKRDEAGQMYRGALDGYKDAVGESHPTTLKVENNLGLLYFDQGNFQASEDTLFQCKKKKEKLFGSDHPSTLDAIDNLGFLRYCQGRFIEADKLMEQSLTGWKKIGHRQHILATQINRGMVCIGLGRFDEAEEILKQSQVQAQELLDPDHPFIAEVTHNLGVLSLERGAIHEAKKQLQYALDKRGKIFGANHTST